MKLFMSVIVLSLVILPVNAFAAGDDENDRNVVYRQTTEIDFEDLEIEGALQKPQSALVLERKKASFNPLVKLRTDWNDEMSQSADEIK